MLSFNYYARDKEGNPRRGVVEAIDKLSAAKILKERELVVISIEVKTEGVFGVIRRRMFSRIGTGEVVNFTRQLATMINAGLVITDALTILKSQTENPNMAFIIDSIQKDIEGGNSLSGALSKYPNIFSSVYVALVKSGETAGILDKILTRLADNLEKQREFEGKIKGAMIYPVIVVSGMVLVAIVMMIFVVPKLLDLYKEFEATLPLPTVILMAASNFMVAYWWVVLVILAAGGWFLRRFLATRYGKIKLDELFFAFPVIGKLRKAMLLTEFTRTLGMLIGGGILVVDALAVGKGAIKSAIFQEAIDEAAREVEKGTSLAVALAKAGVFPPLLPQMISVGEETGKLDEVMMKISSYFEQEGEVAIRNLSTAIEPLIMVTLGIGVGFLIVAVIMPIYNLTSQF